MLKEIAKQSTKIVYYMNNFNSFIIIFYGKYKH